MKTKEDYIDNCIQYILAHEEDDYIQWCKDEGREVSNYKANSIHIYVSAVLALKELNK